MVQFEYLDPGTFLTLLSFIKHRIRNRTAMELNQDCRLIDSAPDFEKTHLLLQRVWAAVVALCGGPVGRRHNYFPELVQGISSPAARHLLLRIHIAWERQHVTRESEQQAQEARAKGSAE